MRDSDRRILLRYDPQNKNSDAEGWVIDDKGTKIFQSALNDWSNYSVYVETFGDGWTSGGGGSANAYLSSEQDRVAEAERYYNDFISRISDIAKLESLQSDNAQKFSDMFAAVGEAQQARQRAMMEGTATLAAPRVGIRRSGPPQTDYAAYARQIKGTLPAGAPPMAQIDPSAFSLSAGLSGAAPTISTPGAAPMAPTGVPIDYSAVKSPANITPVSPTPLVPQGGQHMPQPFGQSAVPFDAQHMPRPQMQIGPPGGATVLPPGDDVGTRIKNVLKSLGLIFEGVR